MKEPEGESYEGPSGGIKKESPWLASEDIPLGKEVTVVVEDVKLYRNVEFDKGRKEPSVGTLKFVGKKKELVLNATNRKRMVKMFSINTREWRGKSVILYVDPKVKLMGELVNGLRIKLVEQTTEVSP